MIAKFSDLGVRRAGFPRLRARFIFTTILRIVRHFLIMPLRERKRSGTMLRERWPRFAVIFAKNRGPLKLRLEAARSRTSSRRKSQGASAFACAPLRSLQPF